MATLQQYRSMLVLNKHRLDDELELQSETQERISAEVTRLNTRMLQAKDDLAKTEARLLLDFKDGESKGTEAQIKARILRHPERDRAWKLFQEARQDHEMWDGLLRAWEKRGYSISTLSDLYGRQYFSLKSTVRPERRDYSSEREERIAARARESMNEAQPTDTPVRARRREA